MVNYLIRRILYMILLLFLVSIVAFIVIQLPPGDFLSTYIAQLEEMDTEVSQDEIEALRRAYGLDLPVYLQYFRWVGAALRGDFGLSFNWNQPVSKLIGERLALTVSISIITLLFTYIVAVPIGIYSATHQYSPGDYFFTTVGFIGLATPNFLLALILMFTFYKYLGMNVGGLFSVEMMRAAWGWAKVWDMIKHLPIPVVVIGTAGTAGIIRVMRGCLLDELRKQYVVTARTKGLEENKLLFKYPVRIAINPIVSTVGWLLPQIVSGSTITAMVLDLPTTGPMLMQALLSQDMFLSATILMLLSTLTVIGTFISDILLAAMDPRIRYD
jgi:peptide/nickel transport system permease protein